MVSRLREFLRVRETEEVREVEPVKVVGTIELDKTTEYSISRRYTVLLQVFASFCVDSRARRYDDEFNILLEKTQDSVIDFIYRDMKKLARDLRQHLYNRDIETAMETLKLMEEAMK